MFKKRKSRQEEDKKYNEAWAKYYALKKETEETLSNENITVNELSTLIKKMMPMIFKV